MFRIVVNDDLWSPLLQVVFPAHICPASTTTISTTNNNVINNGMTNNHHQDVVDSTSDNRSSVSQPRHANNISSTDTTATSATNPTTASYSHIQELKMNELLIKLSWKHINGRQGKFCSWSVGKSPIKLTIIYDDEITFFHFKRSNYNYKFV